MSAKSIVENISDEGIETFICTLRTKPATIAVSCRVVSLKYSRYSPRTIFAVASLCKKYDIDVMHAHLGKSIITCLLASFVRKTPVVIHERGGISEKGAEASLYRLLLRLLHRRAAAVIANSHAIASELTGKASVDRNKINVIYNPIDFKLFDPERVSREQARENLKIPGDDFVIGFVGRLHPVKGVDVLVRALALLLQRSAHYFLVLAGDGPQRKSLETLTSRLGIADHVRFLGMRDDIPEVMAAFDVGVIPSRQQPIGRVSPELQLNWGGRVAAELMRMKVPVIGSGKKGQSELVKDRMTGLLTQEDNPQEIADAIQKLADDKDLCQQLIDSAYRFCERFDVDEHVRQIARIYKDIAASSRAQPSAADTE